MEKSIIPKRSDFILNSPIIVTYFNNVAFLDYTIQKVNGEKDRGSMFISIRAGGELRNLLKPNIDQYTMQIEVPEGATIREIINKVGIKVALIALVHTKGKIQRFDYVPEDGEIITLQPPVSGG